MNARSGASVRPAYNYAYLDEQTKRMIRRALLKAVAIPGYQVPFGSREMPLARGWGTGGIQITAALIGPTDTLEGDRPGLRRHYKCRLDPPLLRPRRPGQDDRSHVRGKHHPDPPPHSRAAARRSSDPRLPGSATRAAARRRPRKMHPWSEYGLMHVRLYGDIARLGHVATTYSYPVRSMGGM